MKTMLIALALLSSVALGQTAPNTETLVLSLKTISKALAGCRETYTRTAHTDAAGTAPLLKRALSAANYAQDMSTLEKAEGFANGLVAHPEHISGKVLVATLSTMDDVSVGAGSTRFELLSAAILAPQNGLLGTDFIALSEEVNFCQKSLFNAGDDFVQLVLSYIGDEERELSLLRKKP